MRHLLAALALILTGCELYTDDSPVTPDAAVDARTDTCPPHWVACPPGALRSAECQRLCKDGGAVCPNADEVDCYYDCIAEVHTWTGY